VSLTVADRPLRIAIDCRPLVGNMTGIGRYTYCLIEEFAKRLDEVEYFLYAPRAVHLPDECRRDGRFRLRVGRIRPALLWLHTAVPVWIARDRVDVFFGPNYAAPLLHFREYRTVVTVHDAVFALYPETMYWVTRLHCQLGLPLYVRDADAVITDTQSGIDDLLRHLPVEPDTLRAIPLAPFTHPFAGEQQVVGANAAVDRPYVLTVGTLEPRKNLERLLRAFASMSGSFGSVELVVAGSLGWGGVAVSALADELGVGGRVRVVGRVSDSELVALYTGATAFAFPSLYEGFGLPVLEAMSYGVPVVCSRASCLAEVCDSAALLFDPLDVGDIAAKLNLVLQDDTLRLSLREKGLARAGCFSWAATASASLEVLKAGALD
jgi:glycosyltransferase involved in cell wall biosynthesis